MLAFRNSLLPTLDASRQFLKDDDWGDLHEDDDWGDLQEDDDWGDLQEDDNGDD